MLKGWMECACACAYAPLSRSFFLDSRFKEFNICHHLSISLWLIAGSADSGNV